jgi:hypothetical protein
MALAVTHFPKTRVTFAVFFGCLDEIVKEISDRVRDCQDASAHPMLLVGIFAELERRRHVKLVERIVRELLNRVIILSEERGFESGQSGNNSYDSLEAWLEASNLRTSLYSWRDQLEKMVAHIDDLATTEFKSTLTSKTSSGNNNESIVQTTSIMMGQRIRERLEEIKCDYDEMIRKCTQSMDGMTLATQLVSLCRFTSILLFENQMSFPV